MPNGTLLRQLTAVAGSALFLVFGDQRHGLTQLLSIGPMVYLGRLSYAWYLWHWPLLTIARLEAIPFEGLGPQLLPLTASLALAALSHHALETPLRRLPLRTPQPWLGAGAVAIALIVAMGRFLEVRSAGVMAEPGNAAFLERLGKGASPACASDIQVVGCDVLGRYRDENPGLLLLG